MAKSRTPTIRYACKRVTQCQPVHVEPPSGTCDHQRTEDCQQQHDGDQLKGESVPGEKRPSQILHRIRCSLARKATSRQS